MIEDIQATFLHRFTTLARTRLANATAAVTRRDPAGLATAIRDLHSLAGEGGLLGLAEIVPLARTCEDHAKHLAGAIDGDPAEVLAALAELSQAVEQRAR